MNTILPADRYLSLVWPDAWALLEKAVKRTSGKPDVLAALRSHDAQLWCVYDGERLLAAVVTEIKEHEGERRCVFWLVGGSRMREWAAQLADEVGQWARSVGCTVLYGIGRRGWHRIVTASGGERIEDCKGQMAWKRRL